MSFDDQILDYLTKTRHYSCNIRICRCRWNWQKSKVAKVFLIICMKNIQGKNARLRIMRLKKNEATALLIQTQLPEFFSHLKSGSCHFDRASNDKFSVEFWIFGKAELVQVNHTPIICLRTFINKKVRLKCINLSPRTL